MSKEELTQKERLTLGEWLDGKGLSAADVLQCMVEFQSKVTNPDPLLPIWKTALENMRGVEWSYLDALKQQQREKEETNE